MENLTIARPYAKAVFQFALENRHLEAWSSALKALSHLVAHEEVREVLSDPTLEIDQTLSLLKALLGDLYNDDIGNFLKLLGEYRRYFALPDIALEYEALWAQHKNLKKVQVTSAFKLTEGEEKKLQSALEKRLDCKVELHSHVDKSILGGAIVRVGDLVIDGSGRTKLSKLVEYLKGNAQCHN